MEMLGFFMLGFASVGAYGQTPTIRIGTPAPSLASAVSIKGHLPRNFKDGKVHVVEFWATWCAPCRMSFSHLSEIAEKYSGKVDVSGIDVSESSHATNKNFDTLPAVRLFVEAEGS